MLPVDEPLARQEMLINKSMVVMEMAVDDLRQELLQRLLVPADWQAERPPALVRVVRDLPRLGRDVGVTRIVADSKPGGFEIVYEFQKPPRRRDRRPDVLDAHDDAILLRDGQELLQAAACVVAQQLHVRLPFIDGHPAADVDRNRVQSKEIGDFNRIFRARQHEAAIFVERQAEVAQDAEWSMGVQKRHAGRLRLSHELLGESGISHDLADAVVGQHNMLAACIGEIRENALADAV